MRRVLVAAVLPLCLVACHGKQTDTGKAAAAAEVLPGSASDAMIAYDTVKSQPPEAVSTAVDDERPGASRGRSPEVRDNAAAADDQAAPSGDAAGANQAASPPAR